MNPLVSIVICTKNRCKLLPRAIDSALAQSYDNIECIVVNCGSTDDTQFVIDQYTDPKLVSVPLDYDPGREKSLITGLKKATGKYVSFLDDDDQYYSDKIKKQVLLFEQLPNDTAIVYCWGYVVDDNHFNVRNPVVNTIRGDVYRHTLRSMSLCSFISLMFRRELLVSENVFNEECGFYPSDWFYINRLTRRYRVDFVPEFLFEIHSNHIYARMSSNTGFDRIHWAKIFYRFHELFLNDNAEGFKLYPRSSNTHVYSLLINGGFLGRIIPMLRYYIFGLGNYPFDWRLHKSFISGMMYCLSLRR